MSDDIIDKLRNAPRRPDCKHGNRPKSCLECEIEELEAEATASMTEIARLRALVKEAYEEGFGEGKDGGWIVGPETPWKKSHSCAALERKTDAV